MQSMLKKTLAAVALGATALFGSGMAQATLTESFTFANVTSIIIGDKIFSNFTCNGSSNITDFNPCTSITITPLTDGEFGIDFNPASLSLTSSSAFLFADAKIEFEVQTISGLPLIQDFFMSSNGTASGTGSIRDTLEICTTQGCASHIFGPADANTPNLNFADFDLPGGPYNDIWIIDDILSQVGFGIGPGTTSISRLDKVVTQTTPEPASLLLIGAALLGMGAARRRKGQDR